MASNTENQRTEEETTAQNWAQSINLPYFDTQKLKDLPQTKDLTLGQLIEYKIAPIEVDANSNLVLGLTDQTDRTRLAELQQKLPKMPLIFKVISNSGLAQILNRLYLLTFQPELAGKFEAFSAKLAGAGPKDAFQLIAQLAYLLDASDIHIEPNPTAARVRFRIDGQLHPITTANTHLYELFLSDLQVRAGMKWGTDIPQSGRISFDLVTPEGKTQAVDMRLETIPAFHGEEVIVRIFNTKLQQLDLGKMGFSQTQRLAITDAVARPDGMVLTVGPTGSGKTSTLYALINQLNSPEVKIVTLEDPVEYDLPDISQIPIHSEDKELFVEKLRAVLREDPNIVMIGEIRDPDTARTALQAALTGHIVLSTFHAASTAAAISRLMDMMGQNALVASALRLIIAQRLVRRICEHCKENYKPDATVSKKIAEILKKLPDKLRPKSDNLQLHRGKGCPVCHGIGYQGRVAIIEEMPITDSIEKLMTTAGTTEQDIAAQAVKEGMITFEQDGILKVLEGVTTLDELKQVTNV